MLRKQSKKIVAFLFVLFTILLAGQMFQSEVKAQLPPPISPWLNMFNNNRGNPLSNYHTYVRPEQQIIREFQSQEKQIRQQASQQQQLSGEMDKVLDMPRKKPSMGSSRGAGFGQHMHYYQNIPARPVPQFSTPGRCR